MIVNLKNLPPDIYRQIPLSLRAYSDTYEFEELPDDIQSLIQPYLTKNIHIEYGEIYDIYPDISKYGDLATITSKKKLVLEYLKNYLLILPQDYPFDPIFGSSLRQHLHTKDTALRKLLIDQEIQNIIAVISADLQIDIQVLDIAINIANKGIYAEYSVRIDLLIQEEQASITTVIVG